jgi:hypothetical protein
LWTSLTLGQTQEDTRTFSFTNYKHDEKIFTRAQEKNTTINAGTAGNFPDHRMEEE